MPARVDRKTFERLFGDKIPAKAKVRRRSVPGRMNKTEARFERDVLLARQASGEVITWWYESWKYKVGTDTCWYTVDFVVVRADGELEMIDVKGSHHEDDALVKVKAAAAQYPQFHWKWWSYKKKRWTERSFGA